MPSRSRLTSLLFALTAACGPVAAPLRPTVAPTPAPRADVPIRLCGPYADYELQRHGCEGRSVALQFLGVGGFVVRVGEHQVMTAPSFTRQNPLAIAFKRELRPDAAAIERGLAGISLDSVTAVLVGHAHYDHLLDVPYLLRYHARRARVYGSPTTQGILAADARFAERAVAIDTLAAGDVHRAGRWFVTDSAARAANRPHLRFMALRSSHARNFNLGTSEFFLFGWTIGDEYAVGDTGADGFPRAARDWPKGDPYAWVIDVMQDSGAVAFRIFYQDAAARREFIHLPPAIARDPVDVAIVTVGSYGNVEGYPQSVAEQLDPRYLVLGHWENFFRHTGDLRVVPNSNTRELVSRLERSVGGRWVTPAPGATLRFLY